MNAVGSHSDTMARSWGDSVRLMTHSSTCLSCPECARLALLHEEPTVFSEFETEIDPNAEWLETSLISDPDTRMLMQNRDLLIGLLIEILQDRGESIFSKRKDCWN